MKLQGFGVHVVVPKQLMGCNDYVQILHVH